MKVGLRLFQVSLWIVVGVLGGIGSVAEALPATAQEESERVDEWTSGRVDESLPSTDPPTHLPIHPSTSEPATTIADWIAQIEASLVQITDVRVEATEVGLQVILETENGVLDVPETRSIGNALIADIPNAIITEEFSQANPIDGIALVSVSQLPGDRVRVAITGVDAPPVAEVTSEAQGLVLAVTLGDADAVAEEEAIEIVVTGEQDEGYNPQSASTATRTDTPLRDIPQSITVVPRQVLEDRNVQNLTQAVETVAGVIDNGSLYGAPAGARLIRGFGGFDQAGNFRNGLRDVDYFGLTPIETIERVEVLRGPASVLFGALEPGGVINVITRQPLSEPYYNVAFDVGNYGFYQPSVDLSGPLTEDDTLLYRFIASYQRAESFQDFVNSDMVTIAPSLTLNLGDRTDLNLYYEYNRYFADPPISDSFLFSDDDFSPRDFYAAYPFTLVEFTTHRFGYTLNHELTDDWQIRNSFAASLSRNIRRENYFTAVEDERLLTGFQAFEYDDTNNNNYFAQIDVLGEFNTGSIAHQLLMGSDFNRFIGNGDSFENLNPGLPPLDIFDPDYDAATARPEVFPLSQFENSTESYGIYLQDQIALASNLRLLIGGRYDWISYESERTSFGAGGDTADESAQNDGAFSPRIGLVYQPSDTVSLYASYSRSFRQSVGFNPDGETFEPTRGTQYEVGARTDFLDGRLSANLAAYYLTKTNITTPDPDNRNFSIQVGEQRSQGIELDIGGEILPGWNVTLAYAYTDAEVTEDNATPVGNWLPNVPENQASLWTTYTLQEGDLRGLGFGLGLFYVGERQVDLANSATVPEYLRTDAALYYRRGRFNTAINIRNLFDIDYANFSNGGRDYIQRGAPFTIIGSVSWEF